MKSGKKSNAAKVFKKGTTLPRAENNKKETLLSIKKVYFFKNVPEVDILSLEFPLCLLDQTVA